MGLKFTLTSFLLLNDAGNATLGKRAPPPPGFFPSRALTEAEEARKKKKKKKQGESGREICHTLCMHRG